MNKKIIAPTFRSGIRKTLNQFMASATYKIIITLCFIIFSMLIISCDNRSDGHNEHEDYPERKHADIKSEIVLTSHQLEHIDLKTETVQVKEVDIPLMLSGKITLNEALTAHITSRIRGRIEKVHAVISDRVQKDEVLLELYSQEFLAMQSEFIQAEERLKRINETDPEHATAKSIYESAKKKLEVIGLSEAEIQNLADNHTTLTLLPVRAPFAGTLISGEARLGEFVDVGQDFFILANLQNLWALADVFEKDLTLIREGISGEVIPAAYPNDSYKAKLTRIYDVVESASRTIKARFEVSNVDNKLKPEMFVTVKVYSKLGGTNPKVSSSAIMKEKNGSYVFVALNDTTFQRREISVGKETKDYTEILDGLKAGEKVVTRGTFYLKSELSKETFMEDEH
ncbi:MAG: efflux RND transporter periplasmic adaptor subunit [Ignavibacterium album]|uniref:efflux RND transporter periplasmic adaptor subunit n=1 Tax=Ignavibacterium album TaxID=591197 RepID=UPI0026EFFA4B|nr:efflux RND transporter periplasmic adaptor subunit [Ignavibacterium album]MCX8105567.1 efflux RND transporter periplasmic adaptor subunit [Ignavibacterium album]